MTSRLPWNRYHIDADGRITGLTVGHCPQCGGNVTEPNSVTLCETPTKLRKLGLYEIAYLPPELSFDCEDDCVCENCVTVNNESWDA